MKPLKEKVSITLDSDIIKKLKDLAEDDDRSFSQYINMVLKEWISKLMRLPQSSLILYLIFAQDFAYASSFFYCTTFIFLTTVSSFCHYTVRMV